MRTVAFPIPDEVLFAMRMSPDAAIAFARLMTTLGLYGQGGVSIGRCVQIADMHVEGFLRFLGEHETSVFGYDSGEELLAEVANARAGRDPRSPQHVLNIGCVEALYTPPR